jgi:hypothetical protein
VTLTAHPAVIDILEELTDVAGEIVKKPHLAFGFRQRIEALRLPLAAAVLRPYCDGERVIDDFASMLMTALRQLAGPVRPREEWLLLAAHLLTVVRKDLVRAMEQELVILGSEAQR